MLTLAAADTLAGVAQTATTVTCTLMGMELTASTLAEVYKVLDQRQLANAAATIYTAPAGPTTFVNSILVVNTNTTTPQTFQLFRGGTAAANAITPVVTIPAGGWAQYEDGQGWSVYTSFGMLLFSDQTPMLNSTLVADTGSQTSTTEAIISPVLTIPANYVLAGTMIAFELAFSAAAGATAQTTPGIVYQLRLGGIAGTVIATAGIITPATSLAATMGRLEGHILFRTLGATGTAKGTMEVTDPRGTRVAAGDQRTKVGASAAGAGVTIDTTVSKDLVITSKTTIADASCITIGVTGYFTEMHH
jgi:hypothetical protein